MATADGAREGYQKEPWWFTAVGATLGVLSLVRRLPMRRGCRQRAALLRVTALAALAGTTCGERVGGGTRVGSDSRMRGRRTGDSPPTRAPSKDPKILNLATLLSFVAGGVGVLGWPCCTELQLRVSGEFTVTFTRQQGVWEDAAGELLRPVSVNATGQLAWAVTPDESAASWYYLSCSSSAALSCPSTYDCWLGVDQETAEPIDSTLSVTCLDPPVPHPPPTEPPRPPPPQMPPLVPLDVLANEVGDCCKQLTLTIPRTPPSEDFSRDFFRSSADNVVWKTPAGQGILDTYYLVPLLPLDAPSEYVWGITSDGVSFYGRTCPEEHSRIRCLSAYSCWQRYNPETAAFDIRTGLTVLCLDPPMPPPSPAFPPSTCCTGLELLVSSYGESFDATAALLNGHYQRLPESVSGWPTWRNQHGMYLSFSSATFSWLLSPRIDSRTASARTCLHMPDACPEHIGCWLVNSQSTSSFISSDLTIRCAAPHAPHPPRLPAPPGGYPRDPPKPPPPPSLVYFSPVDPNAPTSWETILFATDVGIALIPVLLLLLLGVVGVISSRRKLDPVPHVEMTTTSPGPEATTSSTNMTSPLAQTTFDEPDMSSLNDVQTTPEMAAPPLQPTASPAASGPITLLSCDRITSLAAGALGDNALRKVLLDLNCRSAAVEHVFEEVDASAANFAYIACQEVTPFDDKSDLQTFKDMLVVCASRGSIDHLFIGAWCNPRVDATESYEDNGLEERQRAYEHQLSAALCFACCVIWVPHPACHYSAICALEASTVWARQLSVFAVSRLLTTQRDIRILGHCVPWTGGADPVIHRLRRLNTACYLYFLINLNLLCGCLLGLPCVRCADTRHAQKLTEANGQSFDEQQFCSNPTNRVRLTSALYAGLIISIFMRRVFAKDCMRECTLARQAKTILKVMTGACNRANSSPQTLTNLLIHLPWMLMRDERDALIFSRVLTRVRNHSSDDLHLSCNEPAIALSAYVAALINNSTQGGRCIRNWMTARGLQIHNESSRDDVSLAQLNACGWPKRPGPCHYYFLGASSDYRRSQRTTRGVLLISPMGCVELRGDGTSSAHLRRYERLKPDADGVALFLGLTMPVELFLGIWAPGFARTANMGPLLARMMYDSFELIAHGIELWRLSRRKFELPVLPGSYGAGSLVYIIFWLYTIILPVLLRVMDLKTSDVLPAPIHVTEQLLLCAACVKHAYVSALVAIATVHTVRRLGPKYITSSGAAAEDMESIRVSLS